MNIPAELRYTESHEWIRKEADGTVSVGITDHAQHALGDLVFVEVPEVGRALEAGAACAVVESVKAASDVYSPVSGTVDVGKLTSLERDLLKDALGVVKHFKSLLRLHSVSSCDTCLTCCFKLLPFELNWRRGPIHQTRAA